MNVEPNRLPAEGDHRFTGSEIDRQRPLRFRLDGHLIHGFAGDTVLSAALASGLIGAGKRGNEPLALDERFAPFVSLPRQGRGAVAEVLPMARTPAIDGVDLMSVHRQVPGGLRRAWTRLTDGLRRDGFGLRHTYDEGAPAAPWLATAPSERLAADLVVIGGGTAGMSAASAAARHGERIILIERRSSLGGNAGLFGATGDEEAPEATIARLQTVIEGTPGITVLLRAEAFGLAGKTVLVHQILVENGVPTGKVMAIDAPRIVIATGVVERLPIFSGNRRPGVVGSLEAYDRAARFGVWIGRRTLFSTTTSIAYRLAAQIKGGGVTVERVVDTRIDPQSRFVEISRAYGIPQLQGYRPVQARGTGRSGGELRVSLGPSAGGPGSTAQHYAVDQLTVSGGWQPDLSLWHMAGGASRWDATRHALMGDGALEGTALAGSVAGLETGAACRESGEAAAAGLFGVAAPQITEQQIATIYETADDATPIAPVDPQARSPAYLDGGASLVPRPPSNPRSRRGHPNPADRWQGLGVADIAAAVELELIAGEEAGAIAPEQCPGPSSLAAVRRDAPADMAVEPGSVPAYLTGRFGASQIVRPLQAADGRRFDVGCLIYADADAGDPLTAVGVILGPRGDGRGGGMGLLGEGAATLQTLWVKGISGASAACIAGGPAPAPEPAMPSAAGNGEPASV